MSRPASGDARAAKHAASGRRTAGGGTGDAADLRSGTVDSDAADDLGIADWLESGMVAPHETGPLLSPLGGSEDLEVPLWSGSEPARESANGAASHAARHSRPIDPAGDGRRQGSGSGSGDAAPGGRRSGRIEVPEAGARTPDPVTDAGGQHGRRPTAGAADAAAATEAAPQRGRRSGRIDLPDAGARTPDPVTDTVAATEATPQRGRRSGRIEVPEAGARTPDPVTDAGGQHGRRSAPGPGGAAPQRGRRSSPGVAEIEPDDPLGLGSTPDPPADDTTRAAPTATAATQAAPSAAPAAPAAGHDAPTAFWADFGNDAEPADDATRAVPATRSTPEARAGARPAGGRRAAGRRAEPEPTTAPAPAPATEARAYEPGPGFAAAFGPAAPEARQATRTWQAPAPTTVPAATPTPAADDHDEYVDDDTAGGTHARTPATRTAPRRTGGAPPGRATGGALAASLVVAAVIGFAGGAWIGSRSDDGGQPGDARSDGPGTSVPGEAAPAEGLTLTADPVEVAPNDLIALAGSLAPVEGGIRVSLQHKVGDGEWQDYPASRPITLTTRDDGTFSGSVATDAPGPNLFRLVNVDDPEMVSNEIEVTVSG